MLKLPRERKDAQTPTRRPGFGSRPLLVQKLKKRRTRIAVSDDSIGRIELDPAGTGDVNLAPGMGGSPSQPGRSIAIRHVDIAGGDKACGETQSARGFNHQNGKVPTGAFPEFKCCGG